MNLSRYRILMLAGAALVFAATGLAVAGPNGGTVVGGSATIQGAGTGTVTINQSSQKAIINWNTFDIGNGETTTFNQPNSSSIALNRVVGGLGPTQLLGTLLANGQVFVINGDGILIGPNAVINTAGFLATTNDIRDADFMAGKYNFTIPGNPNASVVNQGTITAASGGFAALVAPGVRNSGTITATLGTVSLAAGNAFTLDFYGDRLITLAVGDQIAGQVIDVATGQTLERARRQQRQAQRQRRPRGAHRRGGAGGGQLGHQQYRRDRGELGRHQERHDRAGRRDRREQACRRAGAEREALRQHLGGGQEYRRDGRQDQGHRREHRAHRRNPRCLRPGRWRHSDAGYRRAGHRPVHDAGIDGSDRHHRYRIGDQRVDEGRQRQRRVDRHLVGQFDHDERLADRDRRRVRRRRRPGLTSSPPSSLAFGGSANLFGTAGNSNSNQSGNNNNLFIASGNDLTITSNPASLATGASYVTVDALQHSLATSNVQISAGIGTISMPGFTPNGNLTVAGSINWSSLSSLNLSANQNITINPGVTIKNTSVRPEHCSVVLLSQLSEHQSPSRPERHRHRHRRIRRRRKIDVSNSYAYVNIEYNPPDGYANPTSYVAPLFR